MKRGESIIAQSGAATSLGVASERSETRSRERRNSGYKSQKELECDEAELRRPTAVLLHPSPPYFIFVEKLRNYLIATQQHITRLPRLGAPVSASRCARLLRRGWPLRYGPRHYLSAYAASLRSVAPGSNSFFLHTQGCAALRLALGYYAFAPLHGAPNSAGVRPQFPSPKLRFIEMFEIN